MKCHYCVNMLPHPTGYQTHDAGPLVQVQNLPKPLVSAGFLTRFRTWDSFRPGHDPYNHVGRDVATWPRYTK